MEGLLGITLIVAIGASIAGLFGKAKQNSKKIDELEKKIKY